jgi:hypothetical protein
MQFSHRSELIEIAATLEHALDRLDACGADMAAAYLDRCLDEVRRTSALLHVASSTQPVLNDA